MSVLLLTHKLDHCYISSKFYLIYVMLLTLWDRLQRVQVSEAPVKSEEP